MNRPSINVLVFEYGCLEQETINILFPREKQSAAKQQLVPFFRPQVLSQMPSCIRRVLVIHVRVILASRGLKAWSCQLETSVLSLKKGVVTCLTVSQLALPPLQCPSAGVLQTQKFLRPPL